MNQENMTRRQSSEGYEDWAVDGERFNASSIIITELEHVSEGSWQPKLYYLK
jgi:hypothetical protein